MTEKSTPPTDRSASEQRWPRWLPLLPFAVAAALLPMSVSGASEPAAATPTTAAAGGTADDDALRLGAEVYSAVCSSCHQPGGVGLSGRFPPLLDNPNVDDADYVEDVIINGLSGEITVNGETFDGVMPAQSTLSDGEIDAVITYIQSGFASPAGPAAELPSGPAAGTELPALADLTMIAAFAIFAFGVVLVLGPRIIGVNDRREITWVDAWLKTGTIVVGSILITTLVPAKVLEWGPVQDLSRNAQDLITLGLWSAAICASLWVLWYAHREKRV